MVREAQVTYRVMSAIKSKNTAPEKLLGQAMWKLGLRYRKHYKIIGKPDFIFLRIKIAVFCDGDFWHGNNWAIRGMNSLEEELSQYNSFWREKIERNIARDKNVNHTLEKEGWVVLRFWESDIKNSPEKCASRVKIIYDASAGK
ncbi:very short patch repair endonuclease [bacterium]|nr:very short patch repair endonuclease [bacterium]